jgi:hypothetical protein
MANGLFLGSIVEKLRALEVGLVTLEGGHGGFWSGGKKGWSL